MIALILPEMPKPLDMALPRTLIPIPGVNESNARRAGEMRHSAEQVPP